jgi:hypothetical protein
MVEIDKINGLPRDVHTAGDAGCRYFRPLMGLNLELRDGASVNERLDLAFCRNAKESTKSSLGDGTRFLPIGILCALLVAVCSAAVVHQTILCKSPIQKISGRIVGFGTVNPGVKIQVLDKPEVWSNDSLSFNQKRKRQSIVASVRADSNGKFEIRDIPKGSYEIEFSGKTGWNPLSVFVIIDPGGSSRPLCVEMSLEGAGTAPSVQPCQQ